jgi:polysaccharide deacetylase family protein (PEP-CTERM system associated)
MIELLNAMTVDVEDYFQVQAFAHRVKRADWDSFPSRVEANIDRILALFDQAGVHGTFFTLGWIAEQHPGMVRRIVAEGHELASHGWDHTRADDQEPEAFRQDVRRTRALLEDIGGVPVHGYRAATFSIGKRNQWTFGILRDEGYRYSSSVNPISHDLYGMPDAPRVPYQPEGGDGLWELPMTTLRAFGRNWPCSGGGYFRLLPSIVYRLGLSHVNRQFLPAIFYFHPWEIDPDQPRIAGVGWKSRLRHYTRLSRMEPGLRGILSKFHWERINQVYIHLVGAEAWGEPRLQDVSSAAA